MSVLSLVSALDAVQFALCAPHEVIARQPNAKQPLKSETVRPLQWGVLNFLHTTDTHGWLAGHMLEGEFSGDWGDLVSFSEHMHAAADARGVDLILVDTGDRHDGNGLSDASDPDGSKSLPIFCEVDYDVVTIGNHELYRGVASLQEFHDIRTHFGDRYIVSNVDVAVGFAWVPLGNKYRLFQTKNQNLTLLALGFLFDFTGNDKDITRVTPVAEELEKPWFQELLQDVLPSVDHIVLAGHIEPRHSPEFHQILHKIRAVNKTIPVSLFAGHSHVRDFVVFDDYAVALQSGRFVETVGWASVNYTQGANPSFSRSYIDFNDRNMALHAGVKHDQFQTNHGKQVSKMIKQARKELDLDHFEAAITETYYMDRAPFLGRKSIFTLLQNKVLPLLTSPDMVKDTTRYIMINTGTVRFDLFKGDYTKDTRYILSPFRNDWFYIPKVPKDVANQIIPIINEFDRVLSVCNRATSHIKKRSSNEYNSIWGWIWDQFSLFEVYKPKLSKGYRTEDDLGDDGDDTIHDPWIFHPIPNALQSVVEGSENDGDTVTLIFSSFLGSFIKKALNQLGKKDLFNPILHGGEDVTELVPIYLNSL